MACFMAQVSWQSIEVCFTACFRAHFMACFKVQVSRYSSWHILRYKFHGTGFMAKY